MTASTLTAPNRHTITIEAVSLSAARAESCVYQVARSHGSFHTPR